MTVAVGPGSPRNTSTCVSTACKYVVISVTNAAPGAVMNYACYDNNSQFWSDNRNTAGAVVHADSSGNASWESYCVYGYWTTSGHHLQASVNGTFSP
jgi:hypothetical protein